MKPSLTLPLMLCALLVVLPMHGAQAAPEDEVRAAGQRWIDGIALADPDPIIGDAAPIKLRFSFVYHKVGAQWLIVDHHSSRVPE